MFSPADQPTFTLTLHSSVRHLAIEERYNQQLAGRER